MIVDPKAITETYVDSSYPYLEIVTMHKSLVVVRDNLIEGDINLLCSLPGRGTKCFKKISLDARNIKLLLKTTGPLIYRKSEEESYPINNVKDYLEAF